MVGSLLVALAVLTAISAVLMAGNQSGKLTTVLAIERLRTVLVDQREDLIRLPTFGRLHLRVENISDHTALEAVTRNDYRPLVIGLSAIDSLLAGIGTLLLVGDAVGSLPITICAAVAVAMADFFVVQLVGSAVSRVLAVRMLRGVIMEPPTGNPP